jgi:trehalose 6-phosphate synthase
VSDEPIDRHFQPRQPRRRQSRRPGRRAFGGPARTWGIWFGWSGQETPEFTGHINFQRVDGVTTATIDLEEQDIDEYYNGYANRTLWPLCHYRIDLAEYERSFAGGYQRANERFADTVRP